MNTEPHIESHLIVETPENIFLEFELAGLGSRFLAYLIDTAMQAIFFIILVYVLAIAFAFIGGLLHIEEISDGWRNALLAIGIFLLYEGYFIFFETVWRGQTIGKKILRLRVVKDEGYPITFMDAAIRNLMRIADALPTWFYFPSYGLGSAVLIGNPQGKRLGDFAAGTLVIKERTTTGFENFGLLHLNPEMVRGITLPNLNRINDDEYFVLRSFFYRKNAFEPMRRMALAKTIAAHFRTKLNISQEAWPNDIRLLDTMMLLIEEKKR